MSGLSCAEAGLAAARAQTAANYATWTPSLCNPPPPRGTGVCVIGSPAAEPAWLRTPFVDHDLDNDGVDDFVLTLVDNEDADGMTSDSDQQVYVISTCTKYPDHQVQVSELVRYDTVTGTLSRKLWVRSE
jgi:hypothetical protein